MRSETAAVFLSQLVSCHVAAHESISGAVSCGILEGGGLAKNLFCLHTGGCPGASKPLV